MFSFLRRLFGKFEAGTKADVSTSRHSSAGMSAESKGEKENAAAPNDVLSYDSAFFCSEALVGRDQKIVGYEFGYPQHMHPNFMEKRARVHHYYDDLLLRHLESLELDSFFGGSPRGGRDFSRLADSSFAGGLVAQKSGAVIEFSGSRGA